MRLFAVLAFAVAMAAASGGCASNCTQNVLNECTPRFQWKDDFTGSCACFLLDLAPPVAKIWVHNGQCTEDINDFFNTTVTEEDEAVLYAWTDNFTVGDNALTFDTIVGCGGNDKRRAEGEENATLALSVLYSPSGGAPVFCGTECALKLKFYTDFAACQSNAPTSDDNDVQTSWRGSNTGSSRRNSGSSRRNSGSSRRNSASTTTGDDGTRRSGGCVNPLYGTVKAANESGSVCQIGQCCGSSFCGRDRNWQECESLEAGAKFLVGHTCGDETCKPKYGEENNNNGAGGATVILGSSLEFAEGAIPVGGSLDVETLDVNNPTPALAAFAGGNLELAFNVERRKPDGELIPGYLPLGTYILVTISSTGLAGEEITVLRYDDKSDPPSFVDAILDCANTPEPAVDVSQYLTLGQKFANGVYTVPICHTSTFVVAGNGDSKDKKDKKDAKDLKVSKKQGKPTKSAKTAKTATKAPKEVEKKAAKKGKAEIAIGVGVAGGAVLLAGVGVLVRRRSNKKSKKPVAGAAPTTSEVAVVSV